jgi:hypothetical protein
VPTNHTSVLNPQDNGEVWTKQLALQCKDAGLATLLVGLHQPPMRIGALRVMMRNACLNMACVDESCK